MAKNKKSSDQQIEYRIEVIIGLLCRFMSRRQIVHYVSKKTDWSVTPRQVDNYIKRAKEIIKEKADPDEISGMLRKNFEMLYKKNMQIEDYRECRAVLESIAKLTGINEPGKVELSGGLSTFPIFDNENPLGIE